MCSPLIKRVFQNKQQQQQVAQTGGMSRRDFLRLGSGAALGAATALHLGGVGRARAQSGGAMRVVDLSQPLTDTAPTFPSFEAPTRTTLYDVNDDGFYAQVWQFAEHSGTHVDAPGHFIDGGALVEAMDPARFIAPLVVIDIAARAEDNPDAQVTPDDILAYEAEYGDIPAGAFVAMHSGWETKYGDVAAFRGTDDEGVLHFPGIHPEAATLLAEERDVVAVGVDTLSLDYGPSATFESHLTLLGAGIYGVENMANMADLVGQTATVFVGLPMYEAGSGGPCRVLAMVEAM